MRRLHPSLPEWLFLGAGLAFVVRYRWLMDDAFVYFRYVDNLLWVGAGLTYNAGEFVEGYSSPLWCLLLAAVRRSGAGFDHIILGLGLASYVAFWVFAVLTNRALSPADGRRVAALNLPLAYLCTNYAVATYFTSGTESPLVQVAAGATALFLARPRIRGLGYALALLPLVRPELSIAWIVVFGRAWHVRRRFPGGMLAAAVVLNGAWLAFRVYYYADLLPNTFWLKNVTDPAGGLAFLGDSVAAYHVLPAALLAAVAFLGLLGAARRSGAAHGRPQLGARLSMLGVALALVAWVVKIGGGFMHYYYLWAAFPLAAFAAGGLAEHALQLVGRRRWPAVGTAFAVGLAILVATWYSPLLPRHPWAIHEEFESVSLLGDPAHHRVDPRFRPEAWKPDARIEDQRAFGRDELPRSGYRGITTRGVCVFVYRRYDHRSVHRFGLTDGFLARVDTPEIKKAHKPALRPMAGHIRDVLEQGDGPGRGMFRRAVERGGAPSWIEENLTTLEVLERKVYNRHEWRENLVLAIMVPPRIDPGELRSTLPRFRATRTGRRSGAAGTGTDEGGDAE